MRAASALGASFISMLRSANTPWMRIALVRSTSWPVRALRATPPHLSYYETVDGMKMDGAALETARKAVAGQGDGRVSMADSQDILKTLIGDGGGITAIEYRTAFHILHQHKFTPEALEVYISTLAKAEIR